MMSNEEFEVFYGENLEFSKRVAGEIVKNPDVAEDITQDVFTNLYIHKGELIPGKERLHALVVKATVNKALDHLKKCCTKAEIFGLEDEGTYASSTCVEDEILEIERYRDIGAILEKLRQENRMNYDIFMKVKIRDLSPELVAEQYGITRNNVNNRIYRTKLWLKKEYEKILRA